jgi:hypothetical protein
MGGNLDSQAQYFLEEIFGKNHKYEVVDGDYGDNMIVEVEGAKDYEVNGLHIEIGEWVNNEGYQEVASFAVISAGSFFPSIDARSDEIDEIDDWDEWFRSKGYDCSEQEITDELKAKVKEWYENSDWMETEMDEGLEGYQSFVLNLKPLPGDTLEPYNVPKLDEINDFLKELKEIIDSHKKK